MKTTIDIADDLVKRARMIQQRDDVTFRALVEEGLRHILDKRAKPAKKFKFRPVVVGEPYKPGMPVPDVARMLAEANDRPSSGRLFEKVRISEPRAIYRNKKKSARRRNP